MSEPELPASMALAWGVREPPRRGPKRALSLDRIVAAGIAVAERDGLAAVSMARVAGQLGASTMALYRYLPAKDDLLELMVDTALGAPPDVPAGGSWRSGLRRWAEGVRDRYRTHPWTLQVPISGPPLGPNNVRWIEFGLAVLAATPLREQQKTSTVLLVSAFVRGEEAITADILARIAATGRPPADYGRVLTGLIDPAEFPAVHRALTAGALEEEDPDDIGMDAEFEFGLERILDGVAALIESTKPKRNWSGG